jgi:RNA recognition motif-containing protein
MRLFVGNLEEDVTERDLDELFGDYGKVTYAKIWINFETGKSRGFGFVELEDDWDAERAIEKLDGKQWNGMNLTVCKARNQK